MATADLPAAEVSPRKFSLNSHPVDDDPVPVGARVLRFAEPATEKPAKTTKESQSSRKKKGKRTTRKRSRRGATTPVLALLMGVLSVYARVLSLFSSVHQMCVYLVVDVLIGVAEEIAKCSSRETLRQVLRFANSIPAFFVSLVDDKFFWRKMRRAYNKGYGAEGAWTQFWEQSMERSSSFNALFELDETAKGGQGAREVRKGEGRKRERRKKRSGSKQEAELKSIPEANGRTRGSSSSSPGVRRRLRSSRAYRLLRSSVHSAKAFLRVPSDRARGNPDRVLFQKLDVGASGFLDDVAVNTQIAIDRYFSFLKGLTRVLMLDASLLTDALRSRGWGKPATGSRGSPRDAGKKTQGNIRRSPSLMVLKASMKGETGSGELSVSDAIAEAGYPVQKLEVETEDGYLLDLYRIPRPESKEVVVFQHGMMDSAYGWVLKGDESAIAFAAYDRGFDVFLANFRGTPPRRCTERVKTFWSFTFNELGKYDMRAVMEKIHEVKTTEAAEVVGSEVPADADYKLRAVGHSLGGAGLLIYLFDCILRGRDHHLHRMVLLSPAGRHEYDLPLLAQILCLMDRVVGPFLNRLNFGMTVYVSLSPLLFPTLYSILTGRHLLSLSIFSFFDLRPQGSVLRVGAQKMAVDVSSLPGLKGLFDILCRIFFGGDRSFGDVLAPYWTPYIQSMPGLCWGIVRHGHQIVNARRFLLYDYGTRAKNFEHYGQGSPPDVAFEGLDVPIDFVAGRDDGVVPAKCVRLQYEEMRKRGNPVTFEEFRNFGHLNFIHQPSEEFTSYLLSRLSLP